MHRHAVVTAYTLGAVTAQAALIRELSDTFKQPATDMRRLFYGTMIQAGIGGFRLPSDHLGEAPKSLMDRIKPIKMDEQHGLSVALERAALGEIDRSKYPREALQPAVRLTSFLQELSIAAQQKRPLITAFNPPDIETAKPVLREDFYVLCRPLMQSLKTLSVDAPLARCEVSSREVDSFRQVLDADLFETYEASQSELEAIRSDRQAVVQGIKQSAMRLTDVFPARLDLKKTGIGILDSIPSIVEELAGRILGAAAKPLVGALTSMIASERSIVIYSFEPTWRYVLESKLARAHEEHGSKWNER